MRETGRTKVSEKQQDMFDNPLARARALKAERRYQQAEHLLEQALRADPADLRAKASLADLYYRQERYRQAMALAGQILREDPDDPRALVVMGNVLKARGKPREAIEYFRLALRVAQTDYLWIRLARCHLAIQQPHQAREAIERAETLAPGTPELFRLRAEVARSLRDPAAEQEAFERAAGAAPEESQAFAAFLLPLLRDLPPRRAAQTSERLRAQGRDGQELNPHLLLFEARSLLAGRDPRQALARLATLGKQDLSDSLRDQAAELQQQAGAALDNDGHEQ
jgi:tetratricopeptide (TPR) repeat protein